MNMFNIIVIPAFLFFGLGIGALRLLTPFGFLYALPFFFILVGAIVAGLMHKTYWSTLLFLAALFGSWLSLIVWIVSSFLMPLGTVKYEWVSQPSEGRSGFPFASVELPPSALGSDIVPSGMWLGAIADHVFWLVIGLLLAVALLRKKTLDEKKISHPAMIGVLIVFSIIPLLYTLCAFTIWFD